MENLALDTLLQQRQRSGSPIGVGLVGAGTMASAVAHHLLPAPPGLKLIAISNRTVDKAVEAFATSGRVRRADSAGELQEAAAAGDPVVTDDFRLLCGADCIDVIVDATGSVEFGAHIAVEAITNRKHLVLVNAELDSTIGPILNVKATENDVVMTHIDGEEPGIAMNLIRYLRTMGLEPVGAGNLKGMLDPYRTPETQREFAAKFGMDPKITTSFADGTKLSMECTILANASGFGVGKRGMHGPACDHVSEIAALLPAEQLLSGGIVDFALGAAPYTGAFAIVHETEPTKMKHLDMLKMGQGPFYVFYVPYHLPHFQFVPTIARAVLHGDATAAPAAGPRCEVAAIAKTNLEEGAVLDGVGGFAAYGEIENASVMRAENLLPMGLADGCRLKRGVAKDAAIGMADVEFPAGRLCDKLYAEQVEYFVESAARDGA